MIDSHASVGLLPDDRCAECGSVIGGEWVSYRQDPDNPENLLKHFGAIVLAGPTESPPDRPEPKSRDFRYPEDLGVFFHRWCAPQAKLSEKMQEKIGKLLAEAVMASYERTIARWVRVKPLELASGEPARFNVEVASIHARRVFTLGRAEWQRLRTHEGRLIELEIERTPAEGVAASAAAIARLAGECSVETESIEVWRYREDTRPRLSDLHTYAVLENLPRRVKLPLFAQRTSVQDSPALRKYLREQVFLVRDQPDSGRWEPKTRILERIVFLGPSKS
jgi:hypothetical protein